MSFVGDYVEFRIDYNVLRALSMPQIVTPTGQEYRFPDAGSRDALCTLIDSSVVEASEHGREDAGDRRIEVRTDAGHLLTIPLDVNSSAESPRHDIEMRRAKRGCFSTEEHS